MVLVFIDVAEGHVKKYGYILIGEDSQVTVLRPSDCEPRVNVFCPWVVDWLNRAANDVECGNTNFLLRHQTWINELGYVRDPLHAIRSVHQRDQAMRLATTVAGIQAED